MTKKFRINLRAPHICLSTLSIMPIIAYLSNRDRPRFFDQVGHETTNASIGNKHFFTK